MGGRVRGESFGFSIQKIQELSEQSAYSLSHAFSSEFVQQKAGRWKTTPIYRM